MNKRTYILLSISSLILIILGGILWYGITSVVSLKDEENVLRGEMQAWIKRSKQTSSLQNTLLEAKKAKASMDNYYFVATEENQIALISEIETLIKDTGSKGEVNSIDVAPDYSRLIGSVTIVGEWNDVYHSLLALEAYPIKINLDDTYITEDSSIAFESKAKSGRPVYRAVVRWTITNVRKPE